MTDNNLIRKFEEMGVSEHSVRSMIGHGLRQGFLTRSDVIDCIPETEFDENILAVVVEALHDAGIPYVDQGDPEERAEEVFDEASETIEDLVEPIETLTLGDLQNTDTDDLTRMYIQEAARVPLLTAAEEVNLAKRIVRGRKAQEDLAKGSLDRGRTNELRNHIEAGREAREHLIRANARLVISVAKKYLNRGLPFLDLIQEGNIGLMRAIRNFDYKRGFKFSTYATWWIRQAVTRSLAEQSRTIRLPVYMSDQVNRMVREQSRLHQQFGRPPSTDELAEAMGLTAEKVEQMKEVVRQPVSLQTPVGEDEDEVLGDLLEDRNVPNPEEAALQLSINEDLRNSLKTLPERELQVLKLRYGLGDSEPLTLNEVGQRMGITRERARQLEAQALDRLRNPGKQRKRGRTPKPRGDSSQPRVE